MRPLLRYRPSPAMVVALISLFVALGGVGYAAATIGSGDIRNNSIRSEDIRNRTIRGKDVRNRTISGRQIKAPRYREVGSPGQPPFQNGVANFSDSYSSAAFLKDNEGFVHLKGTVTATSNSQNGTVAFTLPRGYRPLRTLDIGVIASNSVGFVYVRPNGEVAVGGPSGKRNYGLDSVVFKAGS
jgi:hypothetical protein